MKNIKEPDYKARDILFFIRTRKLFISICGILVGLTVLVAVVFNIAYGGLMESYKTVYADYRENKDKLDEQNLAYLSGIMNGEFSKKELTNIAKGFCTYSMEINNQQIKENQDFFYSSSSTVTITIIQNINQKISGYMPEEILKLALVNNIEDYFKFVSVSKSKPNEPVQIATSSGYRTDITFENIKVGESINVVIKNELATKLGLQQGTIEIIYNKESD